MRARDYQGLQFFIGFFIEQINQLLGHRIAQLFGIGNRYRATIMVRDVVPNPYRNQLNW